SSHILNRTNIIIVSIRDSHNFKLTRVLLIFIVDVSIAPQPFFTETKQNHSGWNMPGGRTYEQVKTGGDGYEQPDPEHEYIRIAGEPTEPKKALPQKKVKKLRSKEKSHDDVKIPVSAGKKILMMILAVIFTHFMVIVIAIVVVLLHHARIIDWFPALSSLTGPGYPREVSSDMLKDG
ncbi:hypothetical protein V3C99_003007, partial [Haemonchus contortus]